MVCLPLPLAILKYQPTFAGPLLGSRPWACANNTGATPRPERQNFLISTTPGTKTHSVNGESEG